MSHEIIFPKTTLNKNKCHIVFDIRKSEQNLQVFVFITKFIFCELILFTSYVLIKYKHIVKRTLAKMRSNSITQAPYRLCMFWGIMTVIYHICTNLLVPRYTKTNTGNPGSQIN